MARSQADSINAYNAALNPFADWTFGAYAHEVGQFGIGETKGFANFGAQTLTLGMVSAPFAASNESQANGAGTSEGLATVGSYFTGGGEAAAVEGGAAKILAGAESKIASKGCFLAGTPVQMADGTTKPIEQVRAGDLVKSRDPKTGVTEARQVLQTTVRQTEAVLALSLTDPKTGHREVVTTTGEHPFYVSGKGFVKAEDLGIGTSLVTRAGPALTLSAMAWQTGREPGASLLGGKPASFTVYNLIVAGDHTYFVGTAGGGAWVHNIECPIPTGLYKDIWGHHIHAKAGFNGPGSTYDEDLALTVSDAEIATWGGAPHMGVGSMTSKQNQLLTELRRDITAGTRQNSMKEHSKIAVEVLMHGGLSRENARKVVALSLRNLRSQGVRAPNRIFGSRR